MNVDVTVSPYLVICSLNVTPIIFQKYIRDNATNLGFANIFGNAVREKWLMSHIKTVCLSVRNSFRQEVNTLRNQFCSKPLLIASPL